MQDIKNSLKHKHFLDFCYGGQTPPARLSHARYAAPPSAGLFAPQRPTCNDDDICIYIFFRADSCDNCYSLFNIAYSIAKAVRGYEY